MQVLLKDSLSNSKLLLNFSLIINDALNPFDLALKNCGHTLVKVRDDQGCSCVGTRVNGVPTLFLTNLTGRCIYLLCAFPYFFFFSTTSLVIPLSTIL